MRTEQYVLIGHGEPDRAFALRDAELPALKEGQAILACEGFGLNFADVMARRGIYQDAPPLPCVIGYEAVGRLLGDCGPYRKGQRMLAFTRFGGYASHIVVDGRTIRPIPEEMPLGEALALAVQFCTAYHAAHECVNVFADDHVLVHAAAGGVGTLLVQLLKLKGCTIYGTAGSDAKLELLRQQGVHHPINYRKQDFVGAIKHLTGTRGLDVVFDPLGGSTFRRGFGLLGKGGRIVGFGASEQLGGGIQFIDTLRLALNFGLFSPIQLLVSSRAMIGINMLHIADERPHVLGRCMEAGIAMWQSGEIRPIVGAEFPHTQLADAHRLLESRQSMGKVVVRW
jgi:NADPH2:quinone reductase